MRISWQRIILVIVLGLVMFMPFLSGIEVNAEEENIIEVIYSSYNDLEPEYALKDMTNNKGLAFQEQNQEDSDGSVDIVVNPSITYQTWEGFGGSVDGATVYKILGLSEEDQDRVMNDLFNTKTGNGYNLMRLSIGCSDFTIDSPETNGIDFYNGKNAGSGYWTYADSVDEDVNSDGINDSDMNLSGFSIQKDIDNGQIDLLKKAIKINPNVEFFASMWSAPAWMKKNNDIVYQDGQVDPELREDCYGVLAEYYCKYIEAYKAQGIPIKAVTLQNEPDIKIAYPSMMFTPENQIRFAECLSSAFQVHGLDVEIWGLDANEFRTWEYAVPLLESEVGDEIDGIGYHNYGGLPMSYPNSLHERYPDKTYHITEMTIGGAKLVEYMRNWINSYAYWITYYDIDLENRSYGPGPSFWSKPQSDDADHWSLSQIADDGNGSYKRTAKYNTFGQFSRYIDKGAVRIASSEAEGNVSNVAFQNLDGSVVVVVVNRNASISGTNTIGNTPEQKICISTPEGEFVDTVPGDTIATYTWMPKIGDWITEDLWKIEASHEDNRYFSYQAIDNNPKSFFFTGTEQTAGQYIMIDLGKTESFDQMTLFQEDDFSGDYPDTLKLLVSEDGADWNEVVTNQKGGNRVTNIKLPEKVDARYVKVELMSEKNKWWNISDVALFRSDTVPQPHTEAKYEVLNTKEQWTVQASDNRTTESYANEILDGNPEIQWVYQAAQKAGYYLIADFKEEKTFDKVSVDFGAEGDYARGFQLYTSVDGNEWSAYGEEQKVTQGDENLRVVQEVSSGIECKARYLKLELTESVNDHWLRINEIDLLKKAESSSSTSLLDKTNWNITASINSDYAHLMINGSSDGENNRWANGCAQQKGQFVSIDMGVDVSFDYIAIDGQSDYARGYQITAFKDGEYETGVEEELAMISENPIYGEVLYDGAGIEGIHTVDLEKPCTARYLKIELTEDCNTAWWSIYEINIGVTNIEYSDSKLEKSDSVATTSEHGIEIQKFGVDSSLNTLWKSNKVQEQGVTTYLINLGESKTVCGIAINNGSEMWQYLEDYEIYAWNDGEEAKLVAKAEGEMSNTRLYFEPQQAKYLWIKAGTSSNANRQFAIADINVYTERINKPVAMKPVSKEFIITDE